MLRVSSRQRLVSWDAFDASVPDGEEQRQNQPNARHQEQQSRATIVMPSNANADASTGTGGTPFIPLYSTATSISSAAVVGACPSTDNDDYYSVAGYTDLSVPAAAPALPPAQSPSRKRDRETTTAPSMESCLRRSSNITGAANTGSPLYGTPMTSSSSLKKTVSFSALPVIPSLVEQDNNNNNNSHGATATQETRNGSNDAQPQLETKEAVAINSISVATTGTMPRTPSLLDLLSSSSIAKASDVRAAVHRSSLVHGVQSKTLVIPRVPSTVGLGSRVASDCSLSSTLSRYMSIPSNLCDVGGELVVDGAYGRGGGGIMGRTGSICDTVNTEYSPSSSSLSRMHQLDLLGSDSLSDSDSTGMIIGAENTKLAALGGGDENINPDDATSILPGDAISTVASYLRTKELRELSTTSADLRGHLAGPAGKHIWLFHAEARWPSILKPVAGSAGSGSNLLERKVVEIVDRVGVSTAGLGNGVETTQAEETSTPAHDTNQQDLPNLSALVGLAARDCPTSMSPCPMPSAAEVPGRQRRIRSGEDFVTVRIQNDADNDVESVSARVDSRATAPSESGSRGGSNRLAVQFVGRVGEGDRSITADAPLPRPLSPVKADVDNANNVFNIEENSRTNSSGGSRWSSPRLGPISVPSPTQTLITLLRSASKISSKSGDDCDGDTEGVGRLRPFVCPYVASEDDDAAVVDMTPRLVAYYEIKIHPRNAAIGQNVTPHNSLDQRGDMSSSLISRNRRRSGVPRPPGEGPEMPPLLSLPGPVLGVPGMPPIPHHLPQPRHNSVDADADEGSSDCIAIGLSTSRFRPAAKMPGWDVHSYGYHSDDGGIFHGAGDMERVYASTYGCGDTVGCGIDYSHGDGGAIFFTLNGKFLSYAWTNVGAVITRDDLYPCVGVDTNCPIEINFGTQPFAFDLASFIEGQRDLIEKALGPLVGSLKGMAEAECVDNDEDDKDNNILVVSKTINGDKPYLFDSRQIEEWGEGIGSSNLRFAPGEGGSIFSRNKSASNLRNSGIGRRRFGNRRSRVLGGGQGR